MGAPGEEKDASSVTFEDIAKYKPTGEEKRVASRLIKINLAPPLDKAAVRSQDGPERKEFLKSFRAVIDGRDELIRVSRGNLERAVIVYRNAHMAAVPEQTMDLERFKKQVAPHVPQVLASCGEE